MSIPVCIGIATIEARKESLLDTLDSLKGQGSVCVYQNDYSDTLINDWYICEWVISNSGDLGASAKFAALPGVDRNVYFLTCDDDLIYPPDYVERMIEGIESYNRKAVCTFHGKELYGPATPWYHAKGNRYPCLKTVDKDYPITIPGTGCMGWHSSLLDVSMIDFPTPNDADLHFGKLCNDKGIKRMVLAHEEGWIKHSEKVKHEDTLYYRYKRDHQQRTDIFNSVDWKL